jgi:predicted hotdog family 3-hydroxylacyl-ACP dehydratase
MLDRSRILSLIPHQGAMCLLDRAERWDAAGIVCRARSHLDAANPLRAFGRLAGIAGAEYALQAAALHGALLGGAGSAAPGYLASLRGVVLHTARLDDAAFGTLRVTAAIQNRDECGMIYELGVEAEDGTTLLGGRGMIALRR